MTELDKRKTNKQEHDSILGASCLENTRIIKKNTGEKNGKYSDFLCNIYNTISVSPSFAYRKMYRVSNLCC